MNLPEFLEAQLDMKVKTKFAKIGMEVRSSKPYIKHLLSLVYKGYDVFDQIYFTTTGRIKGKGIGIVRFAALPKMIVEVPPKISKLEFSWTYHTIFGVNIVFETLVEVVLDGRRGNEESPTKSDGSTESSPDKSDDIHF